jgi:exopolysaccharide biosynthesis protein
MKKICSIFLCLLFLTTAGAFGQNFEIVHPGIEFARHDVMVGGKNVSMSLLRLDPTKVRIDVARAMDASIGVEKTSSIAVRHGAVAAVNAGFFRLDTSTFAGDDVGVLMLDGKLVSESTNGRIALLLTNSRKQTSVNFGNIKTITEIEIGKKTFVLSGIDRERKDNEIIEYTPYFHRTTLTDANGAEIIVRNGKVTAVRNVAGSSVIPADGFVVSISGALREKVLAAAKIGASVKIRTQLTDAETGKAIDEKFEDIVAGVPQLIKDGKIAVTWEQERSSRAFVETRHPRTAVAKLKGGKTLFVVADGRSETSGGIGLADLASYLLELGAVDAMNLDGGGSSTMYLDGKVVNQPSDKTGERKVGDALIVTLRN